MSGLVWCRKWREAIAVERSEHEHDLCPSGSHVDMLSAEAAAIVAEWHAARQLDCAAYSEGQRCCVERLLGLASIPQQQP